MSDVKQHSHECSRKYSEAEQAAKVSLFDATCPRCKLNYDAPEMFSLLFNCLQSFNNTGANKEGGLYKAVSAMVDKHKNRKGGAE
jgi:hypothetical protein